MDRAEVLDRLPSLAQAVQARGDGGGAGTWRLVAFEPGESGRGEVRLNTFGQCRELALQLAELGCIVTVCDGQGHVRLRMWPPRSR